MVTIFSLNLSEEAAHSMARCLLNVQYYVWFAMVLIFYLTISLPGKTI